MTKDVLLAIRGLQVYEDVPEDAGVETVTAAEYYEKNGSHYVIYEEASEGFEKTTKNVIRFRDNSLDLTKRGLINAHMVFEENKKNRTNYSTPFGDILIGINAAKIQMKEEEQRIHVNVEYALEINYEHTADCRISMDIRPRSSL